MCPGSWPRCNTVLTHNVQPGYRCLLEYTWRGPTFAVGNKKLCMEENKACWYSIASWPKSLIHSHLCVLLDLVVKPSKPVIVWRPPPSCWWLNCCRSGCFSIGSCINRKESSLIYHLWDWKLSLPTFQLQYFSLHPGESRPDEDWSIQSSCWSNL